MPVTLRKRKAPEPAPAPPPAKKKAAPKTAAAKAAVAKVEAKVKEAVKPKGKAAKANGDAPAVNGSGKVDAAPPAAAAAKGDTITLEGFGGEVETHEGEKTTLKALVDASKAGVVLFTYPKASTPGCTKQACNFRDSHDELTAGGLAIYGLSGDKPQANSKFKEKQKLQYTMICDPKATLLAAIGLKGGPGKATRGVFVVDKTGKVLAAERGSPDGTVSVVKKIVAETNGAPVEAEEPAKADEAPAAAADAAEEDKKEDKEDEKA